MTELDFLPDWYQARQQRRRSYLMHIWLGASLLAVMGLWFHIKHTQISQCRADLQQLQTERGLVNDQLLKIDTLRAVRDDLVRKSRIAVKLQNRPDAVDVLARMSELLPDGVGLVSLDLRIETVESPAVAGEPRRFSAVSPAGVWGPKVSPSGLRAGAIQARSEPRLCYVLRLTGVAPNNLAMANFIARLSTSPCFTDVSLGSSKDVQIEGRLMCQFELVCRLQESGQLPPDAQEGGDRP